MKCKKCGNEMHQMKEEKPSNIQEHACVDCDKVLKIRQSPIKPECYTELSSRPLTDTDWKRIDKEQKELRSLSV